MSGKKPRDALSQEDKKLWQKVTENITRMNSNQAAAPLVRKSFYVDRAFSPASFQRVIPAPAGQREEAPYTLKDADHNWQQRLRRGKVAPEGRIDLHGMSQDRAYDALLRYIETAHKRGKRIILVITGKGGKKSDHADYDRARGILQSNVPRWLSQAPLAARIVSYMSANGADGGDGALYVVLKRGRSAS